MESYESGSVKISKEVIASISSVATAKVKGVYSLTKDIKDSLSEFFGKKDAAPGVKVEINGENFSIEVHPVVIYGYNLQEVAAEVQNSIKENVEKLSGLKVDSVIVNIEKIHFEKEGEK